MPYFARTVLEHPDLYDTEKIAHVPGYVITHIVKKNRLISFAQEKITVCKRRTDIIKALKYSFSEFPTRKSKLQQFNHVPR